MSRDRRRRGGVRRPQEVRQPGALPKINRRELVAALFADQMIPVLDVNNPNAGLVFDRYLRVWGEDQSKLMKEGRGRVLRLFAQQYEDCGRRSADSLEQIHKRLAGVCAQFKGKHLVVETRERFVTGLGAAHPLDNGFAFDYCAGVPFLPGSSVKGLARQYAHELADPSIDIDKLFGSEEDGLVEDQDRETGDLIFLAAYPESWPPLDVDVINCHYPSYYAEARGFQSETRAKRWVGPIEFESPVPVFFLTVGKGARFVFRCGSRCSDAHLAAENTAVGKRLIQGGLAEFGIGGKTALGYGVMKVD